MQMRAQDVNEKQFHDSWRGYNQEEVDDFLDRVAETIDELERENEALGQRVADLDQKIEATRGTEEMLRKTLASAQTAAQEAITSAKAKAEEIVADAEERARRAREELRMRVETAEQEVRSRTEEVEREQAARRREVLESVDRLQAFEGELKRKLKAFMEQNVQALEVLEERQPIMKVPAAEPAIDLEDDAESDAAPGPADVLEVDEPVLESDSETSANGATPRHSAGPDDEFEVMDDPNLDDFAPVDEDDAFAPGRRRKRGLFGRREAREAREAEVPSEEG